MDCIESTNAVVTTVFTTGQCQKTLRSPRRKGRAGGQTTVEFALICLPFFIILFAIIDFAEIYFYENSLQNALREACRFATAGRVIQATDAQGNLLYDTNNGVVVPRAIPSNYGSGEASRNECIRYWFMSNSAIKNFPISNITIYSAATLPGVEPTVTTNGTWLVLGGTNLTKGPGQYNDYVQITATYHVSTITPLMGYMSGYGGVANTFPVHVSAIVKNEPAILNFSHLAIYTNSEP
jgi:Flp pilus assembly protein TadG